MLRPNRVKEYRFSPGSLTAASTGLFDVFSDHSINGRIQKVEFLDTTYTATGSVLIFASGLANSGTGLNELLINIRAGSENQSFYPFVYATNPQGATGSPQIGAQFVINAPLRVVGSGLGNGTSGIGLNIYYI